MTKMDVSGATHTVDPQVLMGLMLILETRMRSFLSSFFFLL